ncbi:DUF3662 and FHA domain-containing protein [Nostocoides veronense]|uniref:Antibiotic biosynthesis regulator FhaA n=1 Tax=Nostocoides veronense TaxID=330836 RepID=A0ABN2LKK0_9MICO
MGRLQRIEGKLERAINGVFAKAFRAEVQPVEIASAVRRAMDDGATSLAKGRTFVPTRYLVDLSETDYDRLTAYEDDLRDELLAAAEEHAESQRYQAKADFGLRFRKDTGLETGLFRITAEDQPQHAHRDGQVGERSTRRPRPERHDEQRDEARGERRSVVPEPEQAPLAPVPARAARPAESPWSDGTHEPDFEYDARTARQGGDPLETITSREPAAPATPPRPLQAADRPWLEIDGDRYPLIGPVTVLGRDTDANIVLADANISRRHCEVRVTSDGPHLIARVKDLDSTNGTWVNGERTRSMRLSPGDRITIGQTSLIYRAGRR